MKRDTQREKREEREVIRSVPYNVTLAITGTINETSKEKLSTVRPGFIKGTRMVKVPVLFI